VHRVLVAAAVFGTVLLGLPAPGLAAPARGSLAAVTEGSIESGRLGGDSVRPGHVSRGVIGVRNTGSAPVTGLVVEVHLNDDKLRFARQYDNCWYALEGKPDSAWCEFADALVAKSVLALRGPVFAVQAGTAAGARVESVRFAWASKEWADANGGIQALADKDASEGSSAVRGTQGTLTLEPGSPRLRSGPDESSAQVSTTVLAPTGPPPTGLPAIPPSDPDPAQLAAVQERSDNIFQGPVYDLGPDQPVPGVVGVRNLGDTKVDGLVVELRLSHNDLKFAKKFTNCWYALQDKPDSAWCEFGTALAPAQTLRVASTVAATVQEQREEIFKDVRFHWVSKQWAESHGGIEALARGDASPGTDAVRGTEGTLTLRAGAAGLAGHLRGSTDFVLGLWPPGATEPTTSPTATPTATATSTPAPGGEGDGGGGGGGLPVTGTPTALVLAVGGGLLVLGAAGFAVARRRRTRFLA
jgi:hypothetical protein